MIVLYSLEPDIKEWMEDAAHGKFINDLCSFLEEHTIINVVVACACIAMFFWKGYGIWKDNDLRLYRPLLILLGLEVVYLVNNLKSITIIFGATYSHLLKTLLFGAGAVVLYKVCKTFANCKNLPAQSRGFSTDDIDIKNYCCPIKIGI